MLLFRRIGSQPSVRSWPIAEITTGSHRPLGVDWKAACGLIHISTGFAFLTELAGAGNALPQLSRDL